jgi:uncharacterized protein YabN with tetrapyrrole methylase and pyrophosphatase domain
MSLDRVQQEVADFNTVRGWDKDTKYLKDFLLNMCEEVGEAWSLIKWIDHEEQKKIFVEHKDQFKDFVGDQLFLILKVAWLLDINSGEALEETLAEYEQRFPIKETLEKKHGNPLAGGIDNKQQTINNKQQ